MAKASSQEPVFLDVDPEGSSASTSDASGDRQIVAQGNTFRATHIPQGRMLQPQYLCFRSDYVPDNNSGEKHVLDVDAPHPAWYEVLTIDEWTERHGPRVSTEYVFVSYSRSQFYVPRDEEKRTWNLTEGGREKFECQKRIDKGFLISIGIEAARRANVPAFWIDFECIGPVSNIGIAPQFARPSDMGVRQDVEIR